MSLELYYVAVPFFVWGVGVLTNYQIVKSSALNERWRLFDKVRAIRNEYEYGSPSYTAVARALEVMKGPKR